MLLRKVKRKKNNMPILISLKATQIFFFAFFHRNWNFFYCRKIIDTVIIASRGDSNMFFYFDTLTFMLRKRLAGTSIRTNNAYHVIFFITKNYQSFWLSLWLYVETVLYNELFCMRLLIFLLFYLFFFICFFYVSHVARGFFTNTYIHSFQIINMIKLRSIAKKNWFILYTTHFIAYYLFAL